MFGVDSTELIIVAVLALLFIGPKELPSTMRTVGRWVGKIRAVSRHFTSGLEAMIREAELEEMEKKWREENDRIMREHPQIEPPTVEVPGPTEPSPDEPRLPLGDSDKGVLP
ncbi:MAG: Sec-independent protein translocase subunit TatA/TatB [Sphingomicrobium sp.]